MWLFIILFLSYGSIVSMIALGPSLFFEVLLQPLLNNAPINGLSLYLGSTLSCALWYRFYQKFNAPQSLLAYLSLGLLSAVTALPMAFLFHFIVYGFISGLSFSSAEAFIATFLSPLLLAVASIFIFFTLGSLPLTTGLLTAVTLYLIRQVFFPRR